MRKSAAIIAVLLVCCRPWAAQLDVTFQDGFEGYAGTEDFMMYQPPSVAFVNYGVSSTLTAGINRWGEHYTSIIRFDSRCVSPGSRVTGAKLMLYHRSKEFPTQDLTVDMHELTPANADWQEGTGDGERVPTPGAPCWSYRKHDSAKWAGSGGAREPDIDFSTQWVAKATVPAKTEGWVTFTIPPAAAQRWIDGPQTNAGLHLWPSAAKAKGDVAYFIASETEDYRQRPKLILSLQRTPELASTLNRATVDRTLAVAQSALGRATERAGARGMPSRTKTRLDGVAQAIADLGRQRNALDTVSDESATSLLGGLAAQQAEIRRILEDLPAEAGAEHNRGRGLETDFALGVASSMVKVFRRDVPFDGRFADTVSISLARNEHEGAQVVVVPIDVDLDRVTWELRGLQAEGISASVAPVGYVHSKEPALVSNSEPSEWWPDPLLSFLKTFDVPRGEVQPLWLDVRAAKDTPAGTYSGELVVGAQNAASKTIGLNVRVLDFTLPTQQHLKTIWGMTEGNFSKYYQERYDEEFAWKYFDMFLDHRMAVADLYRTQPTGEEGRDGLYHLADVEALKRLMARGSGWWNVGYVLAPKWALQPERGFGVSNYDEYLDKCVEMFTEEVARLRQAGWPKDRMGIYFLDETSDFETLGKAARVIKQAFGDIPLMTTGYDRSYGIGDSAVAKWMDIWVPLTPRYHEDRQKAVAGRELGKQVWWYICCGPRNRAALNWFTQFPAIRARLLMGTAAWKYDVDGFLYYRVAGWARNETPITSGPFTEWVPQYSGTLPDGDGQIICAGPDGPLTTIRLENIRDGIEDYEYYWLLRDLIAKAEQAPLSAEGKATVERARALLSVPDALLTSVTEYSEDPATLSLQREELATMLATLQRMVPAQ